MDEHELPDAVHRNRDYWNALAPHRRGQPLEFFRDGGTALSDAELAVIGDVRGRRVLQLACSMGDEAISFAQVGAAVTAIDLAPAHLATGRAKAAALGLDVTFLEHDMMSLDPGLGLFDLVHISWGGVCWAPSITDWALGVAAHLRAGGMLVVSEHHPVWETVTVTGTASLTVSGDYFGGGRDGYADPLKAPQAHRDVVGPVSTPRSFVWNLGDVVTAVLGAGLTVRSLQEFADPDMFPGLGDTAASIPATYLLAASR